MDTLVKQFLYAGVKYVGDGSLDVVEVSKIHNFDPNSYSKDKKYVITWITGDFKAFVLCVGGKISFL